VCVCVCVCVKSFRVERIVEIASPIQLRPRQTQCLPGRRFVPANELTSERAAIEITI